MVPYSAPSFSTTSSVRCNSQGTVIDNGTYVKGNNSYSYTNCNSNNTITTNTYYKKSTDSDWTNAMQHFRRGRILYLVVEIYQQRLVMTLSIL